MKRSAATSSVFLLLLLYSLPYRAQSTASNSDPSVKQLEVGMLTNLLSEFAPEIVRIIRKPKPATSPNPPNPTTK